MKIPSRTLTAVVMSVALVLVSLGATSALVTNNKNPARSGAERAQADYARTASSADAPTPEPPSDFKKFAPLAPGQATYLQNIHLTQQTADDRLKRIESTYQVGDLLSPADTEFVRIVAAEAPAMIAATTDSTGSSAVSAAYVHPISTLSFNKSGSLGSATGNVKGSESMNYNGVVSGSWSASFVASGNSYVKKVTAAEHVRMYGLIGTSGFGLVYSADPSSTVSGVKNTFSRSASFTALAAYYTMDYDGTFYTSSSSFNVTG